MYFNLTENMTYNETITYINNTIIIPLESQINSYKTLMWLFIGISILSIFLWIIIRKRIKLMKENKEIIKLKTKQIESLIDKIRKGEKINQIDIRDLPKPIKENIFRTPGFWGKVFGKIFIETNKEGHKPPFMILIRSDMTAEIRHNAKEGEIILEGKDEKKTKKRILLSRSKLIDLKMPNGRWEKIWIHFEDESEGYPLEPVHHSKAFYHIVEAIQMNKNLLTGKKGKFPKIIFIIAGILLIGGGAFWYFSSRGTPPTTAEIQAINNTINQTIQNVTTQYNVVKI